MVKGFYLEMQQIFGKGKLKYKANLRRKYTILIGLFFVPFTAMQHNFNKYNHDVIDSLTQYDYNSIMHYGPYAFSKNRKKTLVPIKYPKAKIGQIVGLSEKDINEINALYDCQSK